MRRRPGRRRRETRSSASWFAFPFGSFPWKEDCDSSYLAFEEGLTSQQSAVAGQKREEEIALVEDSYHKDRIANRRLHPETLMMGYGYAPGLSEGSLKPPIFLTSTFVFENAQQGKDFFDLTSGRRQPRPGEKSGLVYSRFNNPNLEILEDRLAIWDQAERSAVFASGMAALSTTLFAFLRPCDTVLHSRPLYGGNETLLTKQMGSFHITAFGFTDGTDLARMRMTAEAWRAKRR